MEIWKDNRLVITDGLNQMQLKMYSFFFENYALNYFQAFLKFACLQFNSLPYFISWVKISLHYDYGSCNQPLSFLLIQYKQ